MEIAAGGAFAFGVVLGWFVYFTNRYRKGDVQFSDLTTLLGVIGGGAVTALFGDAKTTLFGAYGIGLAVGFFGYFIALVVLVRQSQGIFTSTWFLDGRRKKLADGEEIPIDTRATVSPMDLQLDRLRQSIPVSASPLQSPISAVVEQRDRASAAVADALRELSRRIEQSTDTAERARIGEAHRQLAQTHGELAALRAKDIPVSDNVRSALVKLDVIATELVACAQEMKTSVDAPTTAARMTERATKATGFVAAMFA
jgi:hypothetical protein